MVSIYGCKFDAQGANNKDKVYGLTVKGSEDVEVKDCKFENTGYSAILNHCKGALSVVGCEFDCSNVYNPIEGSQTVSNGNVTVKDCKFVGPIGNNFINFYQFVDGSHHIIENCEFSGSTGNNIVRVSNRSNASTKISVANCNYTYVSGTPDEYTNFLLCQDYTNPSPKQDFTKVTLEMKNVKCNGEVIGEEGPAVGGTFYVYDNTLGLITGEGNDPVVVF